MNPEAPTQPNVYNDSELPLGATLWSDPNMYIGGEGPVTAENFKYGVLAHTAASLANRVKSIKDSNLDPALKVAATEILERGTLHGEETTFDEVGRNGYAELESRAYLARLYTEKPQIAELLVQKHVGGFHGTRSAALAGILENGGLMSTRLLREQGEPVTTGEHGFQKSKGQSSISFSVLGKLSQAARYARVEHSVARTTEDVHADFQQQIHEINNLRQGNDYDQVLDAMTEDYRKAQKKIKEDPESLYATLQRYDFPVLVSVDKEFVRSQESKRGKGHLLVGASELGEFRPAGEEIPLSAIPVIAVPEMQTPAVRKLLELKGITSMAVISIEDLSIKL